MRKATRAQWVKFGIVTLLYLMFLVWVKSWWGLIVLPFIFDIYISKKIPWSFWKKSKNPAVRGIMSWVDAIVFALVAVYFVNIYIFQNYQIPSSSLEKSLLVGDFLYVSKMSYGPRVPNTPLSMPLAQHTLPIFNTKSYIEWPQWKYKRVPGFGKVKLNDIVVFNFPAGDTVALNRQQEDFYSLAYREGQRVYPNKINMDSLTRDQQRTVYDLYYNAGRNLIRTNPQMYGDIVVRPVDRRENYIGRCIGVPGDTLFIDSLFSVISPEVQFNPDKKRLYAYPVDKENLITSLMHTLSIDDDGLMGSSDSTHVRSFSRYEYYLLEQAINGNNWIQPLAGKKDTELRPLIVPGKGKFVRVHPWNITLLRNTLVMHEGKQAEIKNDTLYVDGKPTQHCYFTKDYYWVGANNTINLTDSRLFGFVPQDHLIGKASLVWFSKEKDTGVFDGYRWNRFFRTVK